MVKPFPGPLVGNANPGAVLLQREVDDFAAACVEAEERGAVAVIFASNGAERPFGYHHDRAPPGMVNHFLMLQFVNVCHPVRVS